MSAKNISNKKIPTGATEDQHSSLGPTTRTLAMPSDTNASGDIFGGWVLSQMDIAAGICAGQRAEGRVVTASIDAMSFIRPVHVGDILGVYTTITRVGTSSMDILVEAWVRRDRIGVREQVTEATFTFVGVDDNGKARPLPKAEDLPDYVRQKFGGL